jgi:hypothetical protein
MVLVGGAAVVPNHPCGNLFHWETRFRDAVYKLRRAVAQLFSHKFSNLSELQSLITAFYNCNTIVRYVRKFYFTLLALYFTIMMNKFSMYYLNQTCSEKWTTPRSLTISSISATVPHIPSHLNY